MYYIRPAGGPSRRLTFQGALCSVAGWTPDGLGIIYASNAERPFRREEWLYTVATEGGLPQRVPLGPALTISYGTKTGRSKSAPCVIGRNTYDPARWKRYSGGTAGDLIDASGKGSFTRLVKLAGNLTSPCWLGDRVYFLSDHRGSAMCTLVAWTAPTCSATPIIQSSMPATCGSRWPPRLSQRRRSLSPECGCAIRCARSTSCLAARARSVSGAS